MASIHLLYGTEDQLMEERKLSILSQYMDMEVVNLTDDNNPSRIMEQLSEDSLFGDRKLFCLINPAIVKKSGKNNDAWQGLRSFLLTYHGENPILIIYHDA
ncbi:MAG: DNA polymerase III subunit delta, partial [Veillonella sp.]|nr:DNA polymerase III subunit delta [Veillonella sp.]